MSKEDLELKARIDERVIHKTNNIQMSIDIMHKNMEEIDKKSALMGKDLEYAVKSIDSLSGKFDKFISASDNKFTTKEEHKMNKDEIALIKKDTEEFKKFFWKFIGALTVIVPIITFILQKFYTGLIG